MLLALLAALGAVAADAITGGRTVGGLPGATSAGSITVALPAGWRSARTEWVGRPGSARAAAPALVIAPSPADWATDPTVPGAFVGLVGNPGDLTPAGFLADRPHADCVAAPTRGLRRGGIDWVLIRFACARGKPVIVEAAGLTPGQGNLVYVQLAPPVAGGAEFVAGLLAGIRVRCADRAGC